jgi:tetratricopeptide (TPR) repeat protein
MNDALRKKNREDSDADPIVDAAMPPISQRKTKKWFFILAALILISSSLIGGVIWWRAKGNGSLFVKHAQPAKTVRSAKDATEQSKMRVSPGPEAFPSSMPGPDAPQTDAPEQKEASPPHPESVFPDAFDSDARTAPKPLLVTQTAVAEPPPEQTATTVAETNRPAQEGAHPSLTEMAPKNDRIFEPGPDSSPAPQQPQANTFTRSREATHADKTATPISSKSIHVADKDTTQGLSDTDLFYRKALARHRSGRLAEAARFYGNVLKTDANHRQALLNLAAVYIEQGNFNEAAPILKHLEGLDPRPNGVLLNLAITSLGNNDPEAAISYLDQAEETADTSFWQIQFHRALALARLNRLSEALSLYKKVESKRPGDYRVQFNLALTYDALEDYPQALDYYEKMLKADQTSEKDRSSIVRRVELLRRYLYTNQSQAKRQHDGKTHR